MVISWWEHKNPKYLACISKASNHIKQKSSFRQSTDENFRKSTDVVEDFNTPLNNWYRK